MLGLAIEFQDFIDREFTVANLVEDVSVKLSVSLVEDVRLKVQVKYSHLGEAQCFAIIDLLQHGNWQVRFLPNCQPCY